VSALRALNRFVLAFVLAAISSAAPAQPTESDVKAAFLPRFARYVSWPASSAPSGADPFVLCVIGNDPFGADLDTAVRSQSVDGRRIIVRRLGSASGANGCQVAYVSGTSSESVESLLSALRGKPILTVTDAKYGGARGVIHFALVNGRVRFAIDNSDASRRGLTISSRLLALAVSVKQR
jgi:hypothetical protein